MPNNTGKPFEDLTEHISKIFSDDDTKVEKDVKISSEFGNRQFDVVLTREVAPFGKVNIGVEARDHNKKASITQLDGFKSKLDDCSGTIHKGIIINRKGFSKNAMFKAKRYGIQLYRLEDRKDEIVDSAFAFPIVIQEHRVGSILVEGFFYVEQATTLLNRNILLNGMAYNHFCLDAMYRNRNELHKETIINEPIHSLEMSGYSFETRDLYAQMHIITRNHFGQVNKLPNTVVLKGEMGEESRALIDSKEIMKDYSFREWPNFWDLNEAPDNLGTVMCGSIKPSLQDEFIDGILNKYKK